MRADGDCDPQQLLNCDVPGGSDGKPIVTALVSHILMMIYVGRCTDLALCARLAAHASTVNCFNCWPCQCLPSAPPLLVPAVFKATTCNQKLSRLRSLLPCSAVPTSSALCPSCSFPSPADSLLSLSYLLLLSLYLSSCCCFSSSCCCLQMP